MFDELNEINVMKKKEPEKFEGFPDCVPELPSLAHLIRGADVIRLNRACKEAAENGPQIVLVHE